MKIVLLSLLALVSSIAFDQPTIKVNERRIEDRIFSLALQNLDGTAVVKITG